MEAAVDARRWRARSPTRRGLTEHVFARRGAAEPGRAPARKAAQPPATVTHAQPEAARINMLTAIRRTLDVELAANPRMVVFGEDVGPKGGVHGATLGLQDKYGAARVFDTSLSEEGIIGRAVGMALAGLLPVPEIQFRKYADPAAEQLNDCGTMRWRTRNRFAAPIVVRMPGGFFKCGDPWHSQTNEVAWVHGIGWQVAVPSNAEDAVGLLRAALRGNDPIIFFEHRAMLDGAWARRPYPGDDYVVPFGEARTVRAGERAHGRHLGGDGGALRAGGRARRRSTWRCSICVRSRPGTRRAVLRLGEQDPPLPDRARGQPDRRLRRGDRRHAGAGVLLQPRRPDRAAGHARHPQSPQPGAARGRRAGCRPHLPGHPAPGEPVSAPVSGRVEIRAPAEQTEGTRCRSCAG